MKCVRSVLFFVIALTVLCAGCATPASSEGMMARAYANEAGAPSTLSRSISLRNVAGGEATNVLVASKVDDQAFKAALEASLNNAGFLANDAQSKYLLVAFLQELKQPFFAINMTVTARVQYILYEVDSADEVMNTLIETPYTATLADSISGDIRLRLANEGAIRLNIEKFLAELSAFGSSVALY